MIPSISLSPLINGVRYGWGEINVNISGFSTKDIVGIEYGEEQEKELDYGAGRKAKGTSRGRIKHNCKLTLNFELVEAIRVVAPAGRLTKIAPFPIIVSYMPEDGGLIFLHTLVGCEFKNDSVKWKENDQKLDQEFDLIVQDILWKF